MKPKRIRSYLILIFVTMVWGSAGPIIKNTLAEIPPFLFLGYRFFISALLGMLLIGFGKIKLPKTNDKEAWLLLFKNAFTGNVLALGLLFWGLSKTTVLDTSIIEATMPMVTALMGYYFLKEIVTRRERNGILIAFLGSLITISGPFLEGFIGAGSSSLPRLFGNVAILMFVIADAYSFIIGKKLLNRQVSAYTISNVSYIMSGLIMVPFALNIYGPSECFTYLANLSVWGHLSVLYMALLSGTIAYALWNVGQKDIEASEAGVFRYLIPVFATPIAIVWLGEAVSYHFIAGALVIGIGVFIAEYKGSLSKNSFIHIFGHKR